MSYKLLIEIPRTPIPGCRNQKVIDLVMKACEGKKPNAPLSKANITLIRHAERMLDFEGLVDSMNAVVTALVVAGVIVDGSWNCLGAWNVHQRYRSKLEGATTEILVLARPDRQN